MLNRAKFLAACFHILRPVHYLIIAAVASAVTANRHMVVVKLHGVKVDLLLHGFSRQGGRQTVLVGINGYKPIFVHPQSFITKYRVWMLRQCQQAVPFFRPKLLDRNPVLVVLTPGILLAPLLQIFIEVIKALNGGYRDQGVAAAIAYLVLHVSFFVTGRRITEIRLEPVM